MTNNSEPSPQQSESGKLVQKVGLWGAAMMGLGSIIGTGVFVSIGIAAEVTGPSVVLAIAVAAVVAICNGLSSAQLAACHPVSGGTYEYGYRWLGPRWGFTAGWMFLCAKSASAATAALGLAGYLLHALGQADNEANATGQGRAVVAVIIALAAIALVTLLVLGGIRRSSHTNIVIVSVTLISLAAFVVAGLPTAIAQGGDRLFPLFAPENTATGPIEGFLRACALMFVAFTGYGRVATMAEEVHHPRQTIPRAIITTLFLSAVIYISVGTIAVLAVGSSELVSTRDAHVAPLEIIARQFDVPGVATIVAIGAITAMLGVLVNLVLGLSRVVLAMGRRRDLPSVFAKLNATATTPYPAVIATGSFIGGLAMIGDVKTTWSFSAFTVLVYYAITNFAAIRLTKEERLYSPVIAWCGLTSCLFLAFWVEVQIWIAGILLIALGLIWHLIAKRKIADLSHKA
ncbi:MAG TPA: amino acid permease [Planctomycetaceae bacterium]|nr:amino acid permease [Planctomycetaceae bacterium]